MNVVSKPLTLMLVVLLLSSLLVLSVTPVAVQAVSKPSVPQFSVKLIDNSYDIPPATTTYIDQYTGKETTHTQNGYHVNLKTFEVTIKNQPFTPYTNATGHEINLYYVVQFKGHFGEDKDWQGVGASDPNGNFAYVSDVYKAQSDSGYTVVLESANMYSGDVQMDFRVQAVTGYKEYNWSPGGQFGHSYITSGVESGWSKIQTITMTGGTLTLSPSQATTIPSQSTAPDNNQSQLPDFVFSPTVLLWIGTFLFVGVVIAVVMVFLRRHLKTLNFNNLTCTV